jgi:CRP-like cAMP-binding protein
MVDIKDIRNQVLRSLDIDDFRLLQTHLTRAEFKLGDPFETADAPIERVYFPESGLASIVVRFAPGDDIEVGVAGRENMTGAALVLGDSQSPFECMAQMPGEVFSIAAADLLEALDRSQTLSRHLVKFARALSKASLVRLAAYDADGTPVIGPTKIAGLFLNTGHGTLG